MRTYHDSSEETHCFPAGRVGRNVPVAHCEEGDSDEPQGHAHVTYRLWGFPVKKRCVRFVYVWQGPRQLIQPPTNSWL